jgi:hypothetical protein
MTAPEDRAGHRQQVDDLLRRIDAQRRQQLLLEAAGAYAPGLEQEVEQARQQLAELVG